MSNLKNIAEIFGCGISNALSNKLILLLDAKRYHVTAIASTGVIVPLWLPRVRGNVPKKWRAKIFSWCTVTPIALYRFPGPPWKWRRVVKSDHRCLIGWGASTTRYRGRLNMKQATRKKVFAVRKIGSLFATGILKHCSSRTCAKRHINELLMNNDKALLFCWVMRRWCTIDNSLDTKNRVFQATTCSISGHSEDKRNAPGFSDTQLHVVPKTHIPSAHNTPKLKNAP